MFVLRDARAHAIGFAIELALVFFRQMAVMLGHVALFISLQALFAPFQTARFGRRELAALDPIGDPLLLIGLAAIDLVDPRMSGIHLSRSCPGCVAVLGLGRS